MGLRHIPIMALLMFSMFTTDASAWKDTSEFQGLLHRGCNGEFKPCGRFNIYRKEDLSKSKNPMKIQIIHRCSRGIGQWRGLYWRTISVATKGARGYFFRFKRTSPRVSFYAYGLFRGKWVQGSMRLRNLATDCDTGRVFFRIRRWVPPGSIAQFG